MIAPWVLRSLAQSYSEKHRSLTGESRLPSVFLKCNVLIFPPAGCANFP